MQMAGDPKKKSVHWGVQLFVFFHLFVVVSWSLPRAPDRDVELSLKQAPNYFLAANEKTFKNSKLENYMIWTGLWQYWDMFAPNPSNLDVWVDALVTYEDGEERVYEYPRMKTLSLTKKYIRERYRKYLESAHIESQSHKWPFLAQRIAFLNFEDELNPVVTVELRRHYRFIVPPADGDYSVKEDDPVEYETYSFYVHTVDQEKLLQDAAQ